VGHGSDVEAAVGDGRSAAAEFFQLGAAEFFELFVGGEASNRSVGIDDKNLIAGANRRAEARRAETCFEPMEISRGRVDA